MGHDISKNDDKLDDTRLDAVAGGKLDCTELEEVTGGGDAIQQIQQIIDDTSKDPQNSMGQTVIKPPSQMYPSSAPYNT